MKPYHINTMKFVVSAIVVFSLLLGVCPHKSATAQKRTVSERQQLRQELLELEKQIRPFVKTLQKVSQLVSPSVVSIRVETRFTPKERWSKGEGRDKQKFGLYKLLPPDKRRQPRGGQTLNIPRHGFGSGVIVDERGYVLTNFHLVKGFEDGEITVILHDSSNYEAVLVGTDPNTDLAVLKIEGDGLEVAEFGSSDDVEVGDWVIAIGSPFGYQQTVSAGIISAKGRTSINPSPDTFAYEDFLQTDAAINPGNSGGPLVNLRGEVIGINAAIVTRSGGYQGIGFAITSLLAKEIMLALIEDGRVIRGYIGVGMGDLNEELARHLNLRTAKELMVELGLTSLDGAFITEVSEDTPAWEAGILPGDIIIEIDSKKVLNAIKLQQIIGRIRVGSVVPVKVVRNGTEMKFNVEISEQPGTVAKTEPAIDLEQKLRPREVPTVEEKCVYGVTVEEFTPQVAELLGHEGVVGVIVKSVEPGCLAEKSGVEEDDIISQVGRYVVKDVMGFARAVSVCENEEGVVVLYIKNKGFIRIN